jgi:putative tricarboxylic transport membrane protein
VAIDLKSLEGREPFLSRLSDWTEHAWNFLRSGLMGVVIGVLPGAGPTIASFIAYGTARRAAREPGRSQFGKGNISGVIAPETANNAAVFSSLVPAFSLGIPGSVDAVIIMAALTAHGLVPGPLFIARSSDVAYTIFVGAFVANIVMLIAGLYLARHIARITKVPQAMLGPVILTLALMGAFSVHNSVFEVGLTVFVGGCAYLLRRLGVPMAPIILGAILGPMLERYFVQAIVLYDGPFAALSERPVASGLLAVSAATVFLPLLKRGIFRRETAS